MGKLMENARKAQQQVQQEAMQVQAEMAVTEFEGFDEEETVRVRGLSFEYRTRTRQSPAFDAHILRVLVKFNSDNV